MSDCAAIYIHLPFCISKCAYCDFNSITAQSQVRAAYLAALYRDIRGGVELFGTKTLTSIYFGGGTPTIYPPEVLCGLLHAIRQEFAVSGDVEVTVEANPATITGAGLEMMREAGFNRLSLGVQSFLDDELELLGRAHTAAEAREAIDDARAAGFDNLSLDLIAALPGQQVEDWMESLQEAVEYAPQHLSCYGLSVEPGTPLEQSITSGIINPPDERASVLMYEETHACLVGGGYEHYEISNYALPGFRCAHSENYWHNGEYLGFGAGAWSYCNRRRWSKTADPGEYVERALSAESLVDQSEELDDDQRLCETMMLGLRTTEGIDLDDLRRRSGDLNRYELRLRALEESGLAHRTGNRLTLDPVQGFLLHSEIAVMFF